MLVECRFSGKYHSAISSVPNFCPKNAVYDENIHSTSGTTRTTTRTTTTNNNNNNNNSNSNKNNNNNNNNNNNINNPAFDLQKLNSNKDGILVVVGKGVFSVFVDEGGHVQRNEDRTAKRVGIMSASG